MRWFFVVLLTIGVTRSAGAAGSLKDDMKYGTAKTISQNRSMPAVIFDPDSPHRFMMVGDPAARWIKQLDDKALLGGAFIHSPVVHLKETASGEIIDSVVRFDLGCMFVKSKSKNPVVILDWAAVLAWEKRGGYAKLGLPTKDNFKARVKIIREDPHEVL